MSHSLSVPFLSCTRYRNPTENDGDPMRIETSADTVIAEAPEADDTAETPMYAKHHKAQKRESGRAMKLLSMDFVKKFILYAKARCHPRLTEEAASYIATSYSRLRSKESDSKTLPVTARTLETMIRLSTAHAKCRLSDEVAMTDAQVAMELINFAYYNEATRLEKPKKARKSKDTGSDSEGESGDEGPDGSQSARGTPRSATGTPKGKPGKSPAKKGDEGSDGQGDGEGKNSGEKRKGASGEYDPFDFDEAAPTPSQKAKKTRSGPASAQQAQAAESTMTEADTVSVMREQETEPETIVELTPARVAAFRQRLREFFQLKRARQMNMTKLLAGVNQLHKGDRFTQADAEEVLKVCGVIPDDYLVPALCMSSPVVLAASA